MDPSHDLILNLPEYDRHHFVTFLHDEETGMEAFVAIHRKNGATPSFGATRMWLYPSDTEALRDSLRLSRLMSYKAALAGLPCGGAKGVIMTREGDDRTRILQTYSQKIALLKDSFITGTDMGVEQSDLAMMKQLTPNIIGFNGNSTESTVTGIVHAIRCVLRETFGSDAIQGRSFAIQGLGKIGGGLAEKLGAEGARLFVSDIDPHTVEKFLAAHPSASAVAPQDIHKQEVDVFSPCAIGSTLNTTTVSELSCRIVAGGANNQLESEEMGDILHKMGILYAPDYVVNAGGLIAVFDEYEHPQLDPDRVAEKVGEIEARLLHIIRESRSRNISTNRVANEYAEKIFNAYS